MKKIENIVMLIAFVIGFGLIIVGHKYTDFDTNLYKGLIQELIGLFILIALLFIYNRRYK